MDISTKDINWVIDRLAVYSKYLKIEPIPIITFKPSEIRLALRDNYNWLIGANRRLRQDNMFGFCVFDNNPINNPIIYINASNQTELKGLHEYTEPKIIKKRYHTYSVKHKIGHIEETLIHELLHIKLRQSKHSKKFNNTVKMIYQAINETNIKGKYYNIY